jgi:3-hydroxyethyl bacteriochlorophyllide a dehydrogenase
VDAPALVISELRHAALGRRPVPEPGPDEVLLEVLYSGVSIGTELWAATGKHGGWGEPPFVPGYQAVGTVAGVGASVPEGAVALGETRACFALGTHRRYLTVSWTMTSRLDPPERLEEAALFVQPAVAANALNKAGVGSGDTVLVIGQGLIGQATAKLARLRGAYVVASDVSPERLGISQRHCSDRVIDASHGATSHQLADSFPDGLDVVIESTGFNALVDDGMRCVRTGGTFVFEGFYPDGLSFDFATPHHKQIRAVFPCFIGEKPSWEAILRRIVDGSLDLAPLISHRVPWTEADAVYNELFTPRRDSINGIVIDWREAS